MKLYHFNPQTSFSPEHMEHLAHCGNQSLNPIWDWNTSEHLGTLTKANGTLGNTWNTFGTLCKIYNIDNKIINEVFHLFHLFLAFYTAK